MFERTQRPGIPKLEQTFERKKLKKVKKVLDKLNGLCYYILEGGKSWKITHHIIASSQEQALSETSKKNKKK